MPNWGAEIDVTIVDRKPDFVGDRDACAVYSESTGWLDECKEFFSWFWHPRITKIKLLADHPYYTKDKPMVISREAAIEALRRLTYSIDDGVIEDVIAGRIYSAANELAKAIQRLWDLVPSERPIDNRVIAMRVALNDTGLMKCDNETAGIVLTAFDAKLAELEGGK